MSSTISSSLSFESRLLPTTYSYCARSICKLVRDKPTKAKLEYLKHVIDDNASVALDRLGTAQAIQ